MVLEANLYFFFSNMKMELRKKNGIYMFREEREGGGGEELIKT